MTLAVAELSLLLPQNAWAHLAVHCGVRQHTNLLTLLSYIARVLHAAYLTQQHTPTTAVCMLPPIRDDIWRGVLISFEHRETRYIPISAPLGADSALTFSKAAATSPTERHAVCHITDLRLCQPSKG